MDQELLRDIDGWTKDYDEEKDRCYWNRPIPESAGEPQWDGFSLAIGKAEETEYHVMINVTFERRDDKLLDFAYKDITESLVEAMAVGETFVRQVERLYNLQ